MPRPDAAPPGILPLSLAAACLALAGFLPERDLRSSDPDDLPPDRRMAGEFFARKGGAYPEIRLTVGPEFMRALDAGRPKFDGCSRKVRLKSVPVERVELNGRRLPGKFNLRYRGFCGLHWNGTQKSLKLKGVKSAEIGGYRSLNLNTLNADGVFFDNWGARVLHAAGGIGPSAGFARVFINGRDDGLHQLVENMDQDFLARHFLAKGAIYRERSHVALGRRPWPIERLKVLWKKNALNNAGWEDLRDFNAAVHASIVEDSEKYLKRIDVPHYVNYSAVVTLTGTMHFDIHNIPFYRPRHSSRFIPMAYDFGDSGQGYLGESYPAVQTPYGAPNLLARLFWSNEALRLRVHRRTAALLARYPGMQRWYGELISEVKSEVLRDVKRGLIFESYPDAKERLAFYEGKLAQSRRIVENRIAFLRQAYLRPLLRAAPGWRGRPAFQLALEGAGFYALRFEGGRGKCAAPARLRARVNKGDWEEVGRCESGGKPLLREFRAERNDIARPDDPDGPVSWKNSIGAVLIDVEKEGDIELSGLSVRSLQTGRPVPVRDNWAFDIGEPAGGRVEIGIPGLPYESDLKNKPGYRFVALGGQTQPEHAYDYAPRAGGVLRLAGEIPGPGVPGKYGPMLCWNQEGRKYCHEFDHRYSPPRSKESPGPAEAPEWELRFLDLEKFAACKEFVFGPGKWYIEKPVESAAGCRVVFEPGAELLFSGEAHMVLRGPAVFPEKGDVVTFGAFAGDWGGVILERPGKGCRVHRAHFSHANEFLRGGRRYTAALTVLEPEYCVVQENLFMDNYGDDALNIQGGKALVLRNMFYGNRDAMDFDRGKVEAKRNIIVNSSDDGIDLGEKAEAGLSENLIYGSGDKAVSVGEGAVALIEKSVLKANNVGVGVKENSLAVLDGVLLEENKLALTGYRTPKAAPSDQRARIEGFPVFFRNVLDVKLDGARRVPGAVEKLKAGSYSPKEVMEILKAVESGCSICGQKFWVNAPEEPAGRRLVTPLELFKPGEGPY